MRCARCCIQRCNKLNKCAIRQHCAQGLPWKYIIGQLHRKCMFTKWCASFRSVTSEDLVRHCNKVIFPFPSIGSLSNYPVQYLVQVRSWYRAELADFVALSSCGRGYDHFRTWFRGVSDIMPPTTRRGSRVDRTLDLGNDVMANILCSFASAQDVLNSRCVCTAWRDLIAMPGILLGCTACNHRTVYVDASHLRAFLGEGAGNKLHEPDVSSQ